MSARRATSRTGPAVAGGAFSPWRVLAISLLLLGLLGLLVAIPRASALTFTDVPQNYAYLSAIDDLSTRGIIAGYGNGTFGPNDPVVRQQFAKMIVKTLGLPVTLADVCPFSDVTPGSGPDPLYPDRYVGVAAAHQITKGYPDGLFHPWDNISRAQVITMVVRAAQQLYPNLITQPPASWQSTWDPAFDMTHGPNARLAEYNGLLAGLPLASLDPWGNMPRGEVAQVLYNLRNKIAPPPQQPSPGHLVHFWWTLAEGWHMEDLSAVTQPPQLLLAPPVAWVTQPLLGAASENMAARMADGSVIWFSGPVINPRDWSILSLSAPGGILSPDRLLQGPLVFWPGQVALTLWEHMGGNAANGDLLYFARQSTTDQWSINNLSQITGQHVTGDLVGWATLNGMSAEENLVGPDLSGHLLQFHWDTSVGWKVEDISQVTGLPQKVVGKPTEYTLTDPNGTWEHLAVRAADGDLLEFFRPLAGWEDWQLVNLSQITQRKVGGDPISWVTPDVGSEIEENIAVVGTDGTLVRFRFTRSNDWSTENLSAPEDGQFTGPLTFWVSQVAGTTWEHVGGVTTAGDLLYFYRVPPSAWSAAFNLGQAVSAPQLQGGLASWVTQAGGSVTEHLVGISQP